MQSHSDVGGRASTYEFWGRDTVQPITIKISYIQLFPHHFLLLSSLSTSLSFLPDIENIARVWVLTASASTEHLAIVQCKYRQLSVHFFGPVSSAVFVCSKRTIRVCLQCANNPLIAPIYVGRGSFKLNIYLEVVLLSFISL